MPRPAPINATGGLWALVLALAAGVALAWVGQQPPRPQPTNVAANRFSAGRAWGDVRTIGAVAHPMGSAANLRARDYLLARMTALGLSPQERDGVGIDLVGAGGGLSGANVRNLVGVLPGRDRAAPALALMAHYDSVPNSPGAADDAAGVASALEVVRALKAQGAPARDVMVVLTDGEEAGLMGATAFFRRDPLARHVGFVLNMEARGSSGRVLMFQTGAESGRAVTLFARTARQPLANSINAFVYRFLPNDTDLTIALQQGLPGFNYAFLGGLFDYHSPTATPERFDPATLQDMGDQVLAATQALAFAAALPGRAPDPVYSQVFGNWMIAYPAWAGWLALIAAAGLIAVGWRRVRPSGARLAGIGGGMAGGLYLVGGAAALLNVARLATGAGFGFIEQRPLEAREGGWELALMLLAVGWLLFAAMGQGRWRSRVLAAFGLAVAGCILSRGLDTVALGGGLAAALAALIGLRRPISGAYVGGGAGSGDWLGLLGLGFVLAAIAQAAAPQTAFAFAWPLLAASLGAAITGLGTWGGRGGVALLALLAAAVVGWVGGLAHLIYLSLDMPELLALPLLAMAFALWPLAQAGPRRVALGLGLGLLLLGAVLTAALRLQSPWSARYPETSQVSDLVDQDAGGAWRVDASAAPTAWSRKVLDADGGRLGRPDLWVFGGPVPAAPAAWLAEPTPRIALTRQADGGLELDAQPAPDVRVLSLRLRPSMAMTVTAVQGVPVQLVLKPGVWTRLRWEAPPVGGLHLRLQGSVTGQLQLRYVELSDAWPAGAKPLPPRPPELSPFGLSDGLIVCGTRQLAW